MSNEQKKPLLPISMYRTVGNTVYVAGHGAVDENGRFVGETLEEQMRYTMELFQKTLTQAGVTLSDIVQVRGYVQNPTDLPTYNRLYREYFTEPYPSRTTIVNCLPPGLLFEIDAIAIIAES